MGWRSRGARLARCAFGSTGAKKIGAKKMLATSICSPVALLCNPEEQPRLLGAPSGFASYEATFVPRCPRGAYLYTTSCLEGVSLIHAIAEKGSSRKLNYCGISL